MNEEQIYNRIENYLEGNLSSEEIASFEKELSTDKTLAEQVDLHKAASDYSHQQGLLDFKNKLAAGMPKPEKSSDKSRYLLVAILALLLISSVVVYLSTSGEADNPNSTTENEQQITPENTSADSDTEITQDEVTTESDQEVTPPDEEGIENEEPTTAENNIVPEGRIEKPVVTTIDSRAGEINNHDLDSINALNDRENSEEDLNEGCIGFDPRIYLRENASFNSQGKGEISVKIIRTDENYKIYMEGSQVYNREAVFDNLAEGVYEVFIENDKGCVYTKRYKLTAIKKD